MLTVQQLQSSSQKGLGDRDALTEVIADICDCIEESKKNDDFGELNLIFSASENEVWKFHPDVCDALINLCDDIKVKIVDYEQFSKIYEKMLDSCKVSIGKVGEARKMPIKIV